MCMGFMPYCHMDPRCIRGERGSGPDDWAVLIEKRHSPLPPIRILNGLGNQVGDEIVFRVEGIDSAMGTLVALLHLHQPVGKRTFKPKEEQFRWRPPARGPCAQRGAFGSARQWRLVLMSVPRAASRRRMIVAGKR